MLLRALLSFVASYCTLFLIITSTANIVHAQTGTTEPAMDSHLSTIEDKIKENDCLIKSLGFDYVTKRHISDAFRESLKKAFGQVQPQIHETERDPTFEDTTIEGSQRIAGQNLYISVLQKFSSDGKIFRSREIGICNGRTFDLDLESRILTVSSNPSATMPEAWLNPLDGLWLFCEGRTLRQEFAKREVKVSLLGDEQIGNLQCHKIRLSQVVEDGETHTNGEYREDIWIVPDHGFLLAKAIAYSIMDPARPENITTYDSQSISNGAWVYSGLDCESFPRQISGLGMELESKFTHFEVDQPYKDADFRPKLSASKVKAVVDRILMTKYPFNPVKPGKELEDSLLDDSGRFQKLTPPTQTVSPIIQKKGDNKLQIVLVSLLGISLIILATVFVYKSKWIR